MSDIETLEQGSWLNDIVLDMGLKEIDTREDMHFLNTQFYPVLLNDVSRCAERIVQHHMFSSTATLLPACINNHWLLFIVKKIDCNIEVLCCDSLAIWDESPIVVLKEFLLLRWEKELEGREQLQDITIEHVPLPKQTNTYDCGQYARAYVELGHAKFRKGDVTITPGGIEEFRNELKVKLMGALGPSKEKDDSFIKEKIPKSICMNLESVFQEVVKKTYTQKQLDLIEHDNTYPACSDSYQDWTIVKTCDPCDLDVERRTMLFMKGPFNSHGLKRSKLITSLHSNQTMLKVMNVSSKIVSNFVQHHQRSKRLATNHFEAFKLRLTALKEQDDLHIVTPNKTIEELTEKNFSVLILSKHMIELAVEKGRIFEIVGHDGVYKLTDAGVPVNLYCTITKKDFRGIVLGCSIAYRNNSETLKELLKAFLLYLSTTYPLKYQKPLFSIDEEQSQINALLELDLEFSLCRFHLKRVWRKHLVKKVPNGCRGKIALCLLRLLSSKNNDEYMKEYESLCNICGDSGQHFLEYYNQEHHKYSKFWNSSARCLRSNSLGSTNNVTETAVRLLQKGLQGKFKRFDNLLDHIVKFFCTQNQKLTFPQIHRNDIVKQLQDRFEEGKKLVEQNLVQEGIEGPFVFKVKDYGVNFTIFLLHLFGLPEQCKNM